VWRQLWNKPLFANTMVEIGLSYIERLKPFMEGERWRDWCDSAKPILTLDGPANREESFSFTEHAPAALKTVRISKKRLFAIQGAAQALARWNAQSPVPLLAFAPLNRDDLIATVQRDLCRGWGHITTMHFLTDCGLSCKPDRWLARTMTWLNLVTGVDSERPVPNAREAVLIDRAVKQLVLAVDGEVTPHRLRYFDKILMEASRQGIVERPRPGTAPDADGTSLPA